MVLNLEAEGPKTYWVLLKSANLKNAIYVIKDYFIWQSYKMAIEQIIGYVKLMRII